MLVALLPGVAPLAYDPRKLCLRQSSSPECESRNPCLAAGLHITGDLGVQEHTGAFDVTAEGMLRQQEQQDLGCADVYEMEYGELALIVPANGAHVLLPSNSTSAWALRLSAAGCPSWRQPRQPKLLGWAAARAGALHTWLPRGLRHLLQRRT